MTTLWLTQIQKASAELELRTNQHDLAGKSPQELQRIASRPYRFEHAIRTQLEGMKPRRISLYDRQTVVLLAELVPGGKWLVALVKIPAVRPSEWHPCRLWVHVFDVDYLDRAPVAAFDVRMKLGVIDALHESYLNLQPSINGFVILVSIRFRGRGSGTGDQV